MRTITFLIGLLFVANKCFADDAAIREEINQLKSRIIALEQKLTTQEKCMNDQKQCILDQNKKISEYETKLSQFDTDLHRETGRPIQLVEGLDISAGVTAVIQGTNNVNNASNDASRKISRTDASYSTDITIGKEFKNFDGRAFLHLENGQGNGLEDDLTLYSNVNRDADDDVNVRVTEAWYEQGLFNDKAVITFGKLDPTVYFDDNAVANDETTQFLGRMFRNSPTIDFSDNTMGIRLAYMPKDWIEFNYGVFDGNNDWERITDNLVNMGQITLKTNFFNLPGNYRFYGWNNNMYHTKWTDASQNKKNAYGFGLSFDQKANDVITLFTRYGWQNPEVYNPDITATGDLNYSLEQSWSAGFQVEGKPWKRENDVVAFAIGQVFPSGDYKEFYGYKGKPEGHLEAYYKIYCNKHLSISPDFQYIWNPFGKDIPGDASGVFVGGMRTEIDF
ncbi:MAG: carbohydrate porin [Candidatus Omnitrophica bacterium]|nr:carbohydrate porin [Candidatus Omnitrophota bacterium]